MNPKWNSGSDFRKMARALVPTATRASRLQRSPCHKLSFALMSWSTLNGPQMRHPRPRHKLFGRVGQKSETPQHGFCLSGVSLKAAKSGVLNKTSVFAICLRYLGLCGNLPRGLQINIEGQLPSIGGKYSFGSWFPKAVTPIIPRFGEFGWGGWHRPPYSRKPLTFWPKMASQMRPFPGVESLTSTKSSSR